MLLKISKNNKISIKLLKTKIEKFKSFKFKLDEIDEGICFLNKKIISTYFFCQKTDIIFVDKYNNVIKFLKNVSTEKILISPKKTKYIYILKLPNNIDLKINDKLNIEYTNNEKVFLENK